MNCKYTKRCARFLLYLACLYGSGVRRNRYHTKGTYLIEMNDSPYTTIQVNVKDIDGAANGGEFASDSLRNSTYVFIKDKKDKDSWSIGTADITMPDIKLKKQ